MTLSDYRSLGRSGLVVSPAALGCMTFGTPRWGSPDDVSEAVFNAYIDEGGNFLDTADMYAKGRSEELTGEFIRKRNLRDRVVLATKYSFNAEPGNPNAGGNGRKNLHRALEGSLKRLGTDYVDLFWMHVWDQVTPVEEVLRSMEDLVAAGKIRYFALSDVPAWYAASSATLARVHGVPGPVALQMPYSLIERSIEREHVAAAREFGMGITPWSPLAAGMLSGKYTRDAGGQPAKSGGRLDLNLPSFQLFTERNWRIVEAVRAIATDCEIDMAAMSLAWAMAQPGITSLILGAKTVEQLHANVAALAMSLPADVLQKLDQASRTDEGVLDRFFTSALKKGVFGGHEVAGW